MRLLIAEDEKSLSKALTVILEKNNYSVDAAFDGEEALDYLATGQYDGVILDIMMPKMDGLTVLKKIRAKGSSVPVLMLTAKSEIDDRVTGLDLGANDYLTKPFDAKELLARIRAVTRRQGEVITDKLTFGDLELDLSTCQLSKGAKSTHLNYKEFELLKLLIANQGSPMTKNTLITKIWGYDSEASDNNVEAYISFLRKKMKFVQSASKISAVRGVGYELEAGA